MKVLRLLIPILAACALLAVIGARAGTALYERIQTRDLRGSAADEFLPDANPADRRDARPPTVVRRPKPAAKPKPKAKPKPRRPGRLDGPEWWPTYGYDDARTHVSVSYGHRPPFKKAWRFRAAHYLEFPPAVAYGRLYVPNQRGRFFAINSATGKIIWQKRFRRCIAASPVVSDGVVYQALMHRLPCPKWARGAPGYVTAMDARTGRELWTFRAGVVESSPVLVDGRLYFGSWDHHLYCVRARDGKLLWRFRADDELNSAPAYAAGRIYIGSDGGKIYAVDARTGRQRWSNASYSRQYFYATPTVAYGRVFIGNTDGTVYAYGATTGRLLWARRVGTYVYTAAAVWKKRVLVGTYDGHVLALDAATGDVRWRVPAPAAVHGAPTVLDGLVYFASCGTCGSRGSRYAKRGPFETFALDARNGRRVWSFPDGRYSPIVADRKRVYLVGSTSVYALVERAKRSPAASTTARIRKTSGHKR
ncbi:MAG TPA: PQQ-binding-like beta-propeller repeat protein [Gemmatimonadaceae bacterium]|nr:PQQ-binding-like beta-propeller repeat protein [Gemmatimonadaceae bacterium]